MLKRNTITALWLLFMAVTETTVSQTALTGCDPQKCQDILKPGVNCRTVTEAIACAQTTILPNPDCNTTVKEQAREEIQKGKDYLRKYCHVTQVFPPPECDYQQCLNILIQYGVNCSTVHAAINCARAIIVPSPQCCECIRNETSKQIQAGEWYLKEHHCPELFLGLKK